MPYLDIFAPSWYELKPINESDDPVKTSAEFLKFGASIVIFDRSQMNWELA